MFDFSKLKTVKMWRVYMGNCPITGHFDFGEKDLADKVAARKGGRTVLEYITILEG